MTTARIYKSRLADVRFKVRHGRKHGMPRGRGSKQWRLLYRETFAVHPESPAYVVPSGDGGAPAEDQGGEV